MNSRTADKYKHLLNTDVVRRMLIKYFVTKGFTESFDRVMYPGLVQDLSLAVPVLANKVEVVPHAVDVDPMGGRAVLGWNLFVLGTHRMYLGETHHRDLAELARQIKAGMISSSSYGTVPEGQISGGVARRQVTPRQVIVFLTRVLGRHESGYIDLTPPKQGSVASMASATGVGRGGFTGSAGYGSMSF